MSLIKIGDHVVNLDLVSAAHREKDRLFVYLSGGRWVTFSGNDAVTVWDAIQERVVIGVDQPQRDRAAGLKKAGGDSCQVGNPQPNLELHNAGAD